MGKRSGHPEKAAHKAKKESEKVNSLEADVQPEKIPVENSGQKSQDNALSQNDDLQSHPKFAKFKQGEN